MAQSMTVSGGNWFPTISAITEAGNNYASTTLQSATNQSLISITMPSIFFGIASNNYLVRVRRTDSGINWDTATLQISVLRTGDGTGGGTGLFGGVSTITGGNTNFVAITTSDANFFSGSNYGTTPRSNVPIQYQISGISVLVPVGTYSTTITYTLIDN